MDYSVKNIYDKIKNRSVSVRVPGSKSITARALMIAALADGKSTLYGAQFSDDCRVFAEALRSVGVKVEQCEDGTVNVYGCGGRIDRREAKIYVGSAGTAARFIPAMLAFSDGEYTFDCSEQMKKRPVGPLIRALRELGASFTFLGEEDSFPFVMRGAKVPADSVTVNIEKSSQYLSGILASAVCAGKPFTIRVEGSHGMDYVNMTLDMMWSFGVNVEVSGQKYTICGGYEPKRYEIEPDISAACYFYAANKILGTDIRVGGVMPHTMQGDHKFIELIKNFDGGEVDMSSFSDQVLTLAAIAPYFSRPTRITGVNHIRGQECDRIAAAVENLLALGVRAEETADGLIIYPSEPHGARIKTFGDHRVAMSFAITGLRCDGVVIEDAEVCSKTFSEYFVVLDDVISRLT